MSKHWLMSAVVLALLGAAMVPALARAEDGIGPGGPGAVIQIGEPGGLGLELIAERAEGAAVVRPGEYWLGIAVEPASEPLPAELKLPKVRGLVVENVLPDSPAAKAGIKKSDILLKANDRLLKEPADLVREINKVREGKLALDVLRDGKRQTIAATPAKRPAGAFSLSFGSEGKPDQDALKSIESWMRQVMPQGPGGQMEFHFIHPGQLLPPGASVPGATSVTTTVKTEAVLPDGYKIEIVRENQKPAQVTVTHEKEKWQATEPDLGKLPDKVRPEAQRLLHLGSGNVFWSLAPGQGLATFRNVPPGQADAAPPMPPHGMLNLPGRLPGLEGRLEKQLSDLSRRLDECRRAVDGMNKHVDALVKAVDELRGKPAPPPAVKKPCEKKPPEKKALEKKTPDKKPPEHGNQV
ncbi:MAG: PDZ domain-containing protein [Thermoguttaceae bacterium]|jgi:membrane-associated protease RseP (regulator of RpoE activity)/uncharacterized coiled-coil protein SlyX